MKRLLFPLFALLMVLASCDDNTGNIGGSITNIADMLDIEDTVFNVTSESVIADSVLSRSTTGYIGRVKDPETNSYVTCNFMTQFHTLTNYELFPPDSMLIKNSNGEIEADSCEVIVSYNGYYGDPLALMKCTIHELDRPMEEGQMYYSSYSPIANGLLRKDGGIHIEKSYTLSDQSVSMGSDYVPYFKIPLNQPYTDKQGNTYNNYGTYIMQRFYSKPADFSTPYNFIHNVCPGFYIECTNGIGSVAYVYVTQLNIHYKYKLNGNTISYNTNFTGTEEVLQKTDITQDKASLETLTTETDHTYLKTPSGIFTRLTLPVDDVMRDKSDLSAYKLRNDTINSARFSIHKINNQTDSKYVLPTPETLLAIADTLKNEFFIKGKVTDGFKSTLVNYASSSNSYVFSNISGIITTMAREKFQYIEDYNKKNAVPMTSEQYDALFPNWNKVVLIPVNTNYTNVNGSNVLTKVTHNMGLSSARLEGGSSNPDVIKMTVVYSKFRNK